MTAAASRPPAAPRGRAWLAWLLAIFVVALVPRLVFTAQYEELHPQAGRPVIDEAAYEELALEVAGGDWLGREIFFQEPLYPYWLGVVYAVAGPELASQRTVARRVQAVLGAATAVLVALLGARGFSPRAGLVGGFAFALYRPAIWMGVLLLKENLFLPLFTVFALALLWTRDAERMGRGTKLVRWGLVGLLAGLGALLRGNMLVLAPAFVLWPLARAIFRRGRWKPELPASCAVLAGLALALLPVALRNRAVGGRLVLTTSGAGTNVYGGNNPANPYGLATEFAWVRGIPDHEAQDWEHEAERRLGRELEPTEVSRYWLGQALESARRDPLLHLTILWNKLRLTLSRYEVPDNHFLEWDARWVPFLRLPLPGFALWGTLGLAGLFLTLHALLRRREVAPEAIELTALFALYLATIVLTVTSERARLALVPLLLPFAGAFALRLLRPQGRVRELLACLGLSALVVLLPVLPGEKRAADFDERDFNLAVGWLEEPDRQRELAELVASLEERHPRAPRVLLLAADLDYRRARSLLHPPARTPHDEGLAAAAIEAALARLALAGHSAKPRERFQVDLLAGAILQFLGRFREAAQRYRSALEFDPADRDVRRRLAVAGAEEAIQRVDAAQRRAGLAEALELVEALLAEGPAAPRERSELEQLAAKIRSAH